MVHIEVSHCRYIYGFYASSGPASKTLISDGPVSVVVNSLSVLH